MTGFGYNVNGFGVSGGGAPALYEFTDAQFLSVITGRLGPSLSQARQGLTGTGGNAWKNDTQFFNTSAGTQLWVVPANGNYRIEVWGASGYSNPSYASQGAFGARMRGDFSLSSGQVIKILAGQTGDNTYGGGGGGTFVATNANSPLIVAGGGNNQGPWGSEYKYGSTGTSGTSGSGGSGGSNGTGGTSSGTGAWGGAGFLSDAQGAGYGTKPSAFVNGGYGGSTCNGNGGFGGGSGADGCSQGAMGAGGGYSGGGGASGGTFGGAGGSFNGGSNQSNSDGNTGTATLSGNGKVIITAL